MKNHTQYLPYTTISQIVNAFSSNPSSKLCYSLQKPPRWRGRLKCQPRTQRLGVRITAAIDLSRKTRQYNSYTAERSAISVSGRVLGEEITKINGCPVSQQVWHATDPSLHSSHDRVSCIGPNVKPLTGNGDVSI